MRSAAMLDARQKLASLEKWIASQKRPTTIASTTQMETHCAVPVRRGHVIKAANSGPDGGMDNQDCQFLRGPHLGDPERSIFSPVEPQELSCASLRL
jgi:hypothetical protein